MTSPSGQDTSALKHLLAACKDGEHRYRTAAQYATPEQLKAILHGYAQQRAYYAAELQTALERRGGHSESSGTIAGALHQGWTRIKSAVAGGNDRALLAECERGEEAAREQYEEALKQPLSADLHELFARQLLGIQEAFDRIGALQRAAT